MRTDRLVTAALVAFLVSGCGDPALQRERAEAARAVEYERTGEGLFDLFGGRSDPRVTIDVNRHLWSASLEVLSFLPLEAADPFSGLIVTDWCRVAGSAAPFRVTVYITDPALDARALKVAAFRQAGGASVPVAEAENRQIENAILTRARQMRIAEAGRI